jgi:hypothetical protein
MCSQLSTSYAHRNIHMHIDTCLQSPMLRTGGMGSCSDLSKPCCLIIVVWTEMALQGGLHVVGVTEG